MAADGAVELHVREPDPRGLNLSRLLLVEVTELGDVVMAEQRIVIETDLGVEAEKIALLGYDQGVDLDQARVLVDEQLVEARDQREALLGKRPFQLERRGDHAAMKATQA